MRLQTTGNCVAFGKGINAVIDDNKYTDGEIALVKRLLPLIVATIDDRSWRVRWTAASKFADVISAYDQLPNAMDSLVPAYEKLLQDPEAEVCRTGVKALCVVCKVSQSTLLLYCVGPDSSNLQSRSSGQVQVQGTSFFPHC